MEGGNINSLLPVELLEVIFRYLSIQDLNRAVLVCRRWREVGETPRLWPWFNVKFEVNTNERNIVKNIEVLNFRRLRGVTALKICAKRLGWCGNERINNRLVPAELMHSVATHPGLKEMHIMQGTDLSLIELLS